MKDDCTLMLYLRQTFSVKVGKNWYKTLETLRGRLRPKKLDFLGVGCVILFSCHILPYL